MNPPASDTAKFVLDINSVISVYASAIHLALRPETMLLFSYLPGSMNNIFGCGKFLQAHGTTAMQAVCTYAYLGA